MAASTSSATTIGSFWVDLVRATLYILLGARVEAGETGLIAVPTSEEEVCLFNQIRKRLAASPGWFTKQRDAIRGVEAVRLALHNARLVVPVDSRPDTERDVEPQRAGGYHLDILGDIGFTQTHDRPLAELLFHEPNRELRRAWEFDNR